VVLSVLPRNGTSDFKEVEVELVTDIGKHFACNRVTCVTSEEKMNRERVVLGWAHLCDGPPQCFVKKGEKRALKVDGVFYPSP
jgi:hypothetical protein